MQRFNLPTNFELDWSPIVRTYFIYRIAEKYRNPIPNLTK